MSREFRLPSFRPAIFLLVLLVFSGSARTAGSQEISFGRALKVIRTPGFAIYFPVELSTEALRLASFADEERTSLQSIYGSDPGALISILLSDEKLDLNGYSSTYPSAGIVLYVAPSGLEGQLADTDDTLRTVFVHELTHSLNFQARSAFMLFLAALAGDPVTPSYLILPDSFFEGSAVFSESRTGSGRINDPSAAESVIQSKLEGKFPSFIQISGAEDSWNSGNRPYLFGSRFLDFLAQKYGKERLGDLWKAAGRGNILTGIDDTIAGQGAFSAVYGISLAEAWADFEASGVPKLTTPVQPSLVLKAPMRSATMTAAGPLLVWNDSEKGAVLARDTKSGKIRTLFESDGSLERLDASQDGRDILVSWRREKPDGRQEYTVRIFDIAAGGFTGDAVEGVHAAGWRYPGAGGEPAKDFVAIRDRGYDSDIELVSGSKTVRVVQGSPSLSFDMPAAVDEAGIYALVRIGNDTTVGRIDAVSGAVSTLAADLGQVRYLGRARNGKLLVSFTRRDSLARLAILDDSGDSPVLAVQRDDISGGVHLPVMVESGEIFYTGNFVAGQYLCRYPDELARSMQVIPAVWETLHPGAGRETTAIVPARIETAPAFPLLFRTFRQPSIDLNGAGIQVTGQDLSRRLAWILDAKYNWKAEAVSISLETLAQARPVAIRLGLYDLFHPDGNNAGRSMRVSGAGVSFETGHSLVPSWRHIGGKAGFRLGAISWNLPPGAAYSSPWNLGSATGEVSVNYSTLAVSRYPPFEQRGVTVYGGADAELRLEAAATPAFSLGAGLTGFFPFIGLRLSASGAFSPGGGVLFGPASRSLDVPGGRPSMLEPTYPPFLEYSSRAPTSPWYAFGQISVRPLSIEIQHRLDIFGLGSPLYFRRITGRAGLRAACYDTALGSPGGVTIPASAFFTIEAQFSYILRNLAFSAGQETSYAFDTTLAPAQLQFRFFLNTSI